MTRSVFDHFSPEALLTPRKGRKQNNEVEMRRVNEESLHQQNIFFSQNTERRDGAILFSTFVVSHVKKKLAQLFWICL